MNSERKTDIAPLIKKYACKIFTKYYNVFINALCCSGFCYFKNGVRQGLFVFDFFMSALYTLFIYSFYLSLSVFAQNAAPSSSADSIAVREAEAALVRDAGDPDPAKRAHAAAGIAAHNMGEKNAMLKNMMSDSDQLVRVIAAKGMSGQGDAGVYPILSDALDSSDNIIRLNAVEGMGSLKDFRGETKLILLLKHKDRATRWKAAVALGNLGGERAVAALLSSVLDESEYSYVRQAALDAFVKIGRRPLGPDGSVVVEGAASGREAAVNTVARLKAFKSDKQPEFTAMVHKAASVIETQGKNNGN